MQCPPGQAEELADALLEMRRSVRNCALCHNFTDSQYCALCSDESRDETTLCVVGLPRDVSAIERTREFRGRYHVLGGLINPLEGIGPDQVRTRELLERLEREPIQELVLATDPTVAGEATALYLHRQLKDRFKITRLALGIPLGTDLEYADEVTLGRAFRHRQIL